jgi:ribonucleoside-triphosphate reductase
LGEKLPSWESAAALVRKIAENYRLPYYTLSPTYSICKNHGYLAGEHFTCPHCGTPSEVYSRITGYYRPVQNWNVGKSQEYKERKEYNIANSTQPNPTKANAPAAEESVCTDCDKTLLFTTATCPNCRIAIKMLDDAGILYEKVLAEDTPELTTKLGIRQAPTLVANGQLYAGAGEIKKFIATQK